MTSKGRPVSKPVMQVLLGVVWGLVIISALGVVKSTHDARLQVNRLEELRREMTSLQLQRGQFMLERGAWAAYSRIEKEASSKLEMVLPSGEQLIVVNAK